jgi:uncharacterized protein YndB with AHSA1/START domain
MASSPLAVVARQRYDASPELVFHAFTAPDVLTRWFSPGVEIQIDVLVHEVRPGGRYRFRYREPDGTVSIVAGEFRAIGPPTCLAFTWTWEPPDPHAGVETLVTVDILADGAGTMVVVTHERLPDQRSRDRHAQGWRSTLARLVTA